MSKKTKKKAGRLTDAFDKSRQSVPAIKDALNKMWVLIVVGTLWSAAYVIYMCSEAGVPQNVKQYLAAGLGVLGLMFLYANLRSNKPSDVVE